MPIPHLPYGRTGHLSSRVVFGAAALSRVDQKTADQTLEVLLAHDINHIDVAARYGDAELRVAPWLKLHPSHFFIATKTNERQAGAAREQLEQSLERLGVDHIDLWQMHSLADPIEWDVALSPGGVIDTMMQAREEGLVRFLGVTGHGTQIAANHRRSLARFDFDSVLLPYNYLTMKIPYYADNFNALQETCRERGAAVQTIKSLGYRPWSGRERTASTWYEPLSEPADIESAVHWALGREGIFVITTGDVNILPHFLDAAEHFEAAPSDEAMEALVERTAMEPLFV